MRKYLTALCLSLALLCVPASPALAQKKAVPLKIEGETILVVKSLPFKVVAPEGATLYSWELPAGVDGDRNDNVLTVTKAPAGEFVVRVQMVTVDFEQKKVKKETGEVNVTLGVPKPPDPPDPSTALQKAVKDALAKETVADKELLTLALAEVYGQASGHVTKGTAKTYGQLFTIMTAGVEAAGVKGKLPNIRSAIESNTSQILKGKNTTPIDETNRAKLADELALVCEALRGAVK